MSTREYELLRSLLLSPDLGIQILQTGTTLFIIIQMFLEGSEDVMTEIYGS